MSKIAFLFPGQGSQSVGMGQDLYQEFGFVRELFEMAEELTKVKVRQLCFQGPMEDLTMTVNLQPAVTAVNLAFLAALEREGLQADINAGHSLGEYSALKAAGIVTEQTALQLVHRRGELMHRESLRQQGAMAAIIGLPIEQVQTLVAAVQRQNGIVALANHNTATQIVITGAPEPVKAVSERAAAKGAKTIPLKVSGAWHSPMIKGAEAEYKAYLDHLPFNAPQRPVVFNVTAAAEVQPEEIKTIMVRQLCSPVRWFESMHQLMEAKVDVFIEVGPGKVLAGLLRKILSKEYEHRLFNVNDLKSYERCLNSMA